MNSDLPELKKILQYFVRGPVGVGQPLSTRANERRGRRRRLPGRGGAGAGAAVSWLESLEHRLEGDGCGWGGVRLDGPQWGSR